ncbi:TPA: hypothetical protein ACLAWK_001642, partial [Neisseria meningitidis]
MKTFRRHFRKSGIIKAINLIFMVLSNIDQLNIVKRGVKLKLRPLQNSPKSPKFPPRHLGAPSS